VPFSQASSGILYSCWVVGLSLSDSHPTSSGLDAATAASLSHHILRVPSEDHALLAKHTERCAALSPLLPKQNRLQAPLMGFVKDRPFVDITLRVPTPTEVRLKAAKPQARSVLVVLPDSDGLLHTLLCGLIASRCRPWGSYGSEPVSDNDCSMPSHARPSSARTPFRVFPSASGRIPSPRHHCLVYRNPCPSRRFIPVK
jgi:hypothetical protein